MLSNHHRNSLGGGGNLLLFNTNTPNFTFTGNFGTLQSPITITCKFDPFRVKISALAPPTFFDRLYWPWILGVPLGPCPSGFKNIMSINFGGSEPSTCIFTSEWYFSLYDYKHINAIVFSLMDLIP